VNDLAFYRRVRGTLEVGESLMRLAITSLGWTLMVLAPIVVGRIATKTWRPIAFLISLIVVTALLALCWNLIAWEDLGRPLLVASLLLVAWCWPRGDAAAFAFGVFALLLLPKIALNVQLYHYGFALALPVLALAIVAATCWLPGWMNRQGRNGAFLRGVVVGALLVLCARYVAFMHQRYQTKTIVVGAGANAFRADERARSVNAMVATLRQLPAGETVATVPQGLMVNFLAGRVVASKYLVLMPPEVMMFGVDRIVDDWRRSPPDDVLLIDTDFAEYGAGDFDTGYGAPLYDWMRGHYHLAMRSDDPAQSWMLLRRNATR
jgi:hypothetical protein